MTRGNAGSSQVRSRSLGRVLADTDPRGALDRRRSDLPAPARAPRPVRPAHPPRRGWNRAWAGRAPLSSPRPPVWRATTAQLAGLNPWLVGAMPPPVGVYVGYDVATGASMSCHPIEWVLRGLTTNPNLLATGLPGAGKSSNIKMLMWRLAAFGVATFVPGDIKGEYSQLCRALGSQPIELGRGLPGRVNPLDPGPLGTGVSASGATGISLSAQQFEDQRLLVHSRRLALLMSLAEIRLRRRVAPFEERVLSRALQAATGEANGSSALRVPTVPDVLALLQDPGVDDVAEHRVRDLAELRDLTRDLAAALEAMVSGALSGIFDSHTTIAPDWDSAMVSLDVSRLDGLGEDIVAAALSCLSSWGQAAMDDPARPVTIVARDELWRWLPLPGMVRKIDSDLRLSRNSGTIQLLATHRLSDFAGVHGATAEDLALARALVASCSIRLLLAQDFGPLRAIRDEIGLTEDEIATVGRWGGAELGRALWKVGNYGSYQVQLVMNARELELTATNERMRV